MQRRILCHTRPKAGIGLGVVLALCIMAERGMAQVQSEKYRPCVNYYALGPSACPAPAEPTWQRVPRGLPAAPSGLRSGAADPVQQYLDNYGKPPREFVEFYLNPTPENASRWVEKFNEINTKTRQVSDAWGRATSNKTEQNQTDKLRAATIQKTVENAQQKSATPENKSNNSIKVNYPIGNNATRSQLTYYFSATCPFCARMEPLVSELTRKNKSKLIFTCVDVTPFSPQSGPKPENRKSLPCDWRLPYANEVQEKNIRQTPTFVITRQGAESVVLTGYTEPSKLKESLGL